ncbi:MAG TPA: hypothetical protein VMZ66_10695 [Aeromicrobium sp.]|nr:hypothetical protein [Aeromicrobium sp.]
MTNDRATNDLMKDALDEFIWDLFWTDDLGLWELTWMAAGRTGQDASSLVSWARSALPPLERQGFVRLSVASWPAMKPKRRLSASDREVLAREDPPWYDPKTASLLVLAQASGDPPIAREDRPWTLN